MTILVKLKLGSGVGRYLEDGDAKIGREGDRERYYFRTVRLLRGGSDITIVDVVVIG